MQSVDCVPLIEEIIQEMTTTYKQKKLDVNTKLPKHYKLRSHPEILRIILVNLIHNAFKYTPSKGTVTIHLKDDTLSVANTGP